MLFNKTGNKKHFENSDVYKRHISHQNVFSIKIDQDDSGFCGRTFCG